MITVEAAPTSRGWDCEVEIDDGDCKSRHNVRVSHADVERWGRPGESSDQLVARAFEFLLRRERPEQILKSFDLPDIARYFPEFDQEIRN